eukprot:11536912-Alexandrium_andersonii.AAC.1
MGHGPWSPPDRQVMLCGVAVSVASAVAAVAVALPVLMTHDSCRMPIALVDGGSASDSEIQKC